MYLAIAGVAVAVYFYYDERKVLKSLKGVSGLPADVQKKVDKIK